MMVGNASVVNIHQEIVIVSLLTVLYKDEVSAQNTIISK